MNKKFFKACLGMLATMLALGACNKEPDESNLYIFTGETIETFIQKDSDLTSFNYILTRVGLDRMMASYGQYTCYAPSNEGVALYIDSLYNDPEATIPHNGMTDNSLAGLNDSLCNDIARYHLTNGLYSIIEMGGSGATITTMLGRPISSKVDSLGRTVLNNVSTIISEDNEVTNGLVHKLNRVVPRSSRLLGDTFDRLEGYTIFNEALRKTGLVDSIKESMKYRTLSDGTRTTKFDKPADITDTNGSELYCPTECKIGYTIFAESDEVMRANGINSFEDLVNYANKVYGGAAAWYDYIREKGHTVSTGNDYTNRWNALNMFVAYHILYASMAQDQLVFEKKSGVPLGTSKWNYVNGADPYDYYETMLPHTLLKIWEPQPGNTLYINRYQTFNTLTNEVGTRGTNHTLVNPGIEIERLDITAYNGYIHPIKGMLVYNEQVPDGVLNERLRFEATTFLPEFINNGFRYMLMSEVSAMNGGNSGARLAFPVDYFDNVICYNGEQTKLRYNVKGDYRAYQADAFQGWGQYDLAIKLPPVPSGLYEFRLFYSPMGHGGMMQFYWGTSKNVQEMTALSIPLDVRIQESDPRIGWTAFYEEDDMGVASDEAMKNRGYMRGPYSFCGHPGDDGDTKTTKNCRGDGVVTLRRVLGVVNVKQSDEFWFRFKNVINDDSDLKWQLDFVEFVPMNVVDNTMYSEDWF
ncbi:MAG: fasciclin domain-containing protein [Prevotella sp.]|nr:fasciclin domain-containing protein [Prevotella sp.]